MTILNSEQTLVLIIDVQEKLLNAVFNKTLLEKKAEIIAKASNILEIPTIITEQYPKGLGNTISKIKDNLPNAKYFEKTDFSALNNPELKEIIKKSKKSQIVIFGIETHICVYQTVVDLIKEGFNVVVAKDACASRSTDCFKNGIQLMKDNGAVISNVETILFELLKSSKNPYFKAVQALIK